MKNFKSIKNGNSRALNQVRGPSERGVLCDRIGHLPMAPAVIKTVYVNGEVLNKP